MGTGADGPGVRDVFPQRHLLPPIRQEVCVLPAGLESGTLRLEHRFLKSPDTGE